MLLLISDASLLIDIECAEVDKILKNRLMKECSKLDPAYEQHLVDEGLNEIIR